MRNKYPGYCYYCSKYVDKGEGHFERHNGKWLVIHADCVFKQRKEKNKHC
jgi:hypothetical protein